MSWSSNLADEPSSADGPPWYQSRGAWHISMQNLADEPTLAHGPPSTRAEMPWIPVHKTSQMNLLWLMDLPSQYQSRNALNTSTQTLADEPTLANGPPSTRAEMPCIPVHKTWQMNLLWPIDPQYQSRDAWHISTQNLTDEPTLANVPPVPE